MKRVTEQEAIETAVYLTVFIKGGGQEKIGLPSAFVTELIKSIKTKGYETLQLADGNTIQVTGFLVGGEMFHKETRIIIIGENNIE
jgi:hypothetical protein